MRTGAPAAQRLEPLQRQRQVAAALAAGHRVDLVDDHGAHRDSIARPDSEPSSTYSDSGVVTRMCGGRAAHGVALGLRRVAGAHRGADAVGQAQAASWRMPASGASRLRRMSLDSAFSGDT
jgi:hypothetical protein